MLPNEPERSGLDFRTVSQQLLDAGGVNALTRRLVRPRGVIFMLHSVSERIEPEPFAPNAQWTVPVELLRMAIRVARESGFRAVSLDEAVARCAQPHAGKPFFCVTCDDGYADNATVAWPVCRELEVPLGVYVTSGFVAGTDLPWWHLLEELITVADRVEFEIAGVRRAYACATLAAKRAAFAAAAPHWRHASAADRRCAVAALVAEGHRPVVERVRRLFMDPAMLAELSGEPEVTIGAHTVSHAVLRDLGREDLDRELRASADYLEEVTGERPVHFAYPYGTREEAAVREQTAALAAGFRSAVTTRHGTVPHGMLSLAALPRIPIFPEDTASSIRCKVSGLSTVARRLREVMSTGW